MTAQELKKRMSEYRIARRGDGKVFVTTPNGHVLTYRSVKQAEKEIKRETQQDALMDELNI